MDAGSLDRRITLWVRAPGRDDGYNTPDGGWVPFAKDIWASVQDFLPSRGERVAEGIDISSRPVRIRTRFRPDINSAMRVEYEGRMLNIVAGPAEIGRREAIEIVAEETSTTGDTA